MRPLSVLATAALLTGMPLSALAESGRTLPNFTGPLVTPAVNTLPANMLNIEPYLIHTDTRGHLDERGDRYQVRPILREWQMALPMIYGVTDALSVQLTLNATRLSSGRLHSDGMRFGDTTVRLLQRLKGPEADGTGLVLSVSAAQRLPTGRYHHTGNNALNGVGNGQARTTLAFGAQQLHWMANDHALRWRGQLSWSPSPGRVRVRDESVYGTWSGFRGYATPGQAWRASLAAEYVLDGRWVLVGEAVWDHSRGTDVVHPVAGQPAIAWRYGSSRRISLAPAVEYHVSPTIGLIAGVQFSVGGRRTDDYVAPQVALNMIF
jgi:hypothetical protein